jgi:hypothetical protein
MHEAVVADRLSNQQGKPALKRLMMANEVYSQLKKLGVQQNFLDNKGCQVLADWLDLMPDGTFPNSNLVEGVLNCIDSLQMGIAKLP